MKTQFAVLRSRAVKVSVAVAAMGAAAAHAIDDTAITAAQGAAETSVDLTSTGLIQIVAIIVGVGIVISLLKKV